LQRASQQAFLLIQGVPNDCAKLKYKIVLKMSGRDSQNDRKRESCKLKRLKVDQVLAGRCEFRKKTMPRKSDDQSIRKPKAASRTKLKQIGSSVLARSVSGCCQSGGLMNVGIAHDWS